MDNNTISALITLRANTRVYNPYDSTPHTLLAVFGSIVIIAVTVMTFFHSIPAGFMLLIPILCFANMVYKIVKEINDLG